MKQKYLWFLCLAWLSGLAPVFGQSLTLNNGLKVVVIEDNRAPVVTSQVWYKVGAVDEVSGQTGISHMLEHMMFKGTKSLAPGRFSEMIAENGGDDNAFTSHDYTAYYQNIGKDKLALCFELEADRMHQLRLQQLEFEKEQQVVAEERRQRTEDNPSAQLRELFYATAYVSSGYHHPVVGWMNDIQQYTVADLQHFYDAHYAPNNATVVVAGDVNANEVFALAKKYFGSVPQRELLAKKTQIDQPQRGERRVQLTIPAKVPTLMMGYKVPSFISAKDKTEAYALEVLAYVLDGGQSARFPAELMRGAEIASSVSAGYTLTARLQTMFKFSGIPNEGKTVVELESAIKAELDKLKNTPVSQEELDRIKAQVIAAEIYEKDSTFYQGMSAGVLETAGLDYTALDDYAQKIQAITPEKLMAVAKKYFVESGLTVATLIPQAKDKKEAGQ